MANFHGYVDFLLLGCLFDHSCYAVSLLCEFHRVKKSFKLYNMWTLHESFQETAVKSWAELVSSMTQYILKEKMVLLKYKLRFLNNKHFQHISQQVVHAIEDVEAVQVLLLSGGEKPLNYSQL